MTSCSTSADVQQLISCMQKGIKEYKDAEKACADASFVADLFDGENIFKQ